MDPGASQEAVSRGEWRISSILTLPTPAWDTGDGEFVPLRAFLQVCFGLPGPSRGLWGPVGHSEARGGVAAMIG